MFAGCIGGMRVCLEEILACALRSDHDSMASLEDPLFEGGQETAAWPGVATISSNARCCWLGS